jgi:hypothetical protein
MGVDNQVKLYVLDDMEEIVVLLLRIEHERHKVLFVKGEPYHDKAVRKIKRMQERIEKLGGNIDAKITIQ